MTFFPWFNRPSVDQSEGSSAKYDCTNLIIVSWFQNEPVSGDKYPIQNDQAVHCFLSPWFQAWAAVSLDLTRIVGSHFKVLAAVQFAVTCLK